MCKEMEIRCGVGILSFLTECPSCGELIQNVEPPDGLQAFIVTEDADVKINFQDSHNGKVTMGVDAGSVLVVYFVCECGASFHVDFRAVQRSEIVLEIERANVPA